MPQSTEDAQKVIYHLHQNKRPMHNAFLETRHIFHVIIDSIIP